jgi:prepilin-type N-terminal cleavage/methylation domain-containing protein
MRTVGQGESRALDVLVMPALSWAAIGSFVDYVGVLGPRFSNTGALRMTRGLGHADREEGFTLFELLIVIIILAILAGIVAFSVGNSTASATSSSCQTDAKSFESAIEQYKTQVGTYPPRGPIVGTPYPYLTTPQVAFGQTVGPFLRALSSTAHYQIVTDGIGNVFVYPPAPAHIPQQSAMSTTDVGLEVFGNPLQDQNYMNYDNYPDICSDTNVVS